MKLQRYLEPLSLILNSDMFAEETIALGGHRQNITVKTPTSIRGSSAVQQNIICGFVV